MSPPPPLLLALVVLVLVAVPHGADAGWTFVYSIDAQSWNALSGAEPPAAVGWVLRQLGTLFAPAVVNDPAAGNVTALELASNDSAQLWLENRDAVTWSFAARAQAEVRVRVAEAVGEHGLGVFLADGAGRALSLLLHPTHLTVTPTVAANGSVSMLAPAPTANGTAAVTTVVVADLAGAFRTISVRFIAGTAAVYLDVGDADSDGDDDAGDVPVATTYVPVGSSSESSPSSLFAVGDRSSSAGGRIFVTHMQWSAVPDAWPAATVGATDFDFGLPPGRAPCSALTSKCSCFAAPYCTWSTTLLACRRGDHKGPFYVETLDDNARAGVLSDYISGWKYTVADGLINRLANPEDCVDGSACPGLEFGPACDANVTCPVASNGAYCNKRGYCSTGTEGDGRCHCFREHHGAACDDPSPTLPADALVTSIDASSAPNALNVTAAPPSAVTLEPGRWWEVTAASHVVLTLPLAASLQPPFSVSLGLRVVSANGNVSVAVAGAAVVDVVASPVATVACLRTMPATPAARDADCAGRWVALDAAAGVFAVTFADRGGLASFVDALGAVHAVAAVAPGAPWPELGVRIDVHEAGTAVRVGGAVSIAWNATAAPASAVVVVPELCRAFDDFCTLCREAGPTCGFIEMAADLASGLPSGAGGRCVIGSPAGPGIAQVGAAAPAFNAAAGDHWVFALAPAAAPGNDTLPPPVRNDAAAVPLQPGIGDVAGSTLPYVQRCSVAVTEEDGCGEGQDRGRTDFDQGTCNCTTPFAGTLCRSCRLDPGPDAYPSGAPPRCIANVALLNRTSAEVNELMPLRLTVSLGSCSTGLAGAANDTSQALCLCPETGQDPATLCRSCQRGWLRTANGSCVASDYYADVFATFPESPWPPPQIGFVHGGDLANATGIAATLDEVTGTYALNLAAGNTTEPLTPAMIATIEADPVAALQDSILGVFRDGLPETASACATFDECNVMHAPAHGFTMDARVRVEHAQRADVNVANRTVSIPSAWFGALLTGRMHTGSKYVLGIEAAALAADGLWRASAETRLGDGASNDYRFLSERIAAVNMTKRFRTVRFSWTGESIRMRLFEDDDDTTPIVDVQRSFSYASSLETRLVPIIVLASPYFRRVSVFFTHLRFYNNSAVDPPRCAAFSGDCQACSAQIGCGWCRGSGTCHAGNSYGPAQPVQQCALANWVYGFGERSFSVKTLWHGAGEIPSLAHCVDVDDAGSDDDDDADAVAAADGGGSSSGTGVLGPASSPAYIAVAALVVAVLVALVVMVSRRSAMEAWNDSVMSACEASDSSAGGSAAMSTSIGDDSSAAFTGGSSVSLGTFDGLDSTAETLVESTGGMLSTDLHNETT